MREITKVRFVKDWAGTFREGDGSSLLKTVIFGAGEVVDAKVLDWNLLPAINDGYAVPVWDGEPKPQRVSTEISSFGYKCACGKYITCPAGWMRHICLCGHVTYHGSHENSISPERDDLIVRLTLDRDDARNALRKKIAQVIDISNHRDEWREKAKASEKLCAKAIQERDAERAEKAAVVGKLMFNLDIETQRANSNYDLANALLKQLRDTERERDEAKESLDCMTREQSALDYLNNTRKASTKPAGDRKET